MKVALLISGMYRTHDFVRESWKPIFDLKPDIYFTTWNKNISSHKDTVQVNQPIVNSYILLKYPKSRINIQEHSAYSFKENNQRMMFLWCLGIRDILNAGINYDYIILTRPDIKLFFDEGFSLERYIINIKQNEIHVMDFEVPKSHILNYDRQLNDMFFIGKIEVFKKLLYSDIKKYIHNGFNFSLYGSIHEHTRNLFSALNLDIVILEGIKYNLIRFSNSE